MAGSPPPVPGPPPAAAQASALAAGFQPSPMPVASLCGFKLPVFVFSLGFKQPTIFPLPFPEFALSLGLNCSLENPIDVSAGVKFGGGRVSNADPDPDQQLLAEAA